MKIHNQSSCITSLTIAVAKKLKSDYIQFIQNYFEKLYLTARRLVLYFILAWSIS